MYSIVKSTSVPRSTLCACDAMVTSQGPLCQYDIVVPYIIYDGFALGIVLGGRHIVLWLVAKHVTHITHIYLLKIFAT